jgi:transposase InsO family protein
MEQAYSLQALFAPLIGRQKMMSGLRELADRVAIPFPTLKRKFLQFRRHGVAGLLDKRRLGPSAWNTRRESGLPVADQELVKLYCEKNQRNSKVQIRALRRDWKAGKVKAEAPFNPVTGYPRGWDTRNLYKYAPTKFELKSNRLGRAAAATERSLVYTTRRDLYVGQFYLFDDLWHDHFVNVLDQRKTGRPLEFHTLDLASACKFAWGMRVRMETEAGMDSLKEADFRFLLAYVLSAYGYHPNGTTLVVEHGTAAIKEWLEAFLFDASGGLVKVSRSGMEGAAAHAGQYAGRSKGNFRFKAALESLGNLIHNEMGCLPGQAGKDRDHRPEQLHGLLKHNDALLAAFSHLSPERAAMLQWPLLTIQQFQVIADEIYARINARTDHNLEGWDLHYVPDPRSGGMRRMSPVEVFKPGRRQLLQLAPESIARILSKDDDPELTVQGNKLVLTIGEISGDDLIFDASMLQDREKYRVVVNPFSPDILYAFDSAHRLKGICPRVSSVSRGEIEAVHRACGAAAKREAKLLAPMRQRHLAEARAKTAMHAHNARVLSGAPVTHEEKARARQIADRVNRIGAEAESEILQETNHTGIDVPTERDPVDEIL